MTTPKRSNSDIKMSKYDLMNDFPNFDENWNPVNAGVRLNMIYFTVFCTFNVFLFSNLKPRADFNDLECNFLKDLCERFSFNMQIFQNYTFCFCVKFQFSIINLADFRLMQKRNSKILRRIALETTPVATKSRNIHCLKIVCIWSFYGPYFPAF